MSPKHLFWTRSTCALLVLASLLIAAGTARADYEAFASPVPSAAPASAAPANEEFALMNVSAPSPSRLGDALSTNGSPVHAAPTYASTESRSIRALKLNGTPIEVDGKLDDAPWRDAEPGYDFHIWDPDRGKNPSESTVFKVAYDENALYFGVACHEDDPAKVARCLSRRDQIKDSDLVSIYLDPYLDRSTGYNFRVNPAGVQEDAYMFNDGERDPDWNAVWEAETSSDADGWYTEVRIPFSSIRYRPSESMTWGLQMYRYMHRRGEDTAWVTWDREKSGFVSRFGTLTEMTGVPAPHQLEVLPYFVSRVTDPSAEGDADEFSDFQNFGADLKYGVTADLTLNATIQPDFGQVEADPAVLNRSPHETFYEEKRPFFIEGNRFFQTSSFNMFYSRRIGTGDENSRIRMAGKLTGKVHGNMTVAALYAATDLTAPGQAHNLFKNGDQLSHFMVARLGKDFGKGNHTINFMQTGVFHQADRQELIDQGYSGGNADRLSREAATSSMDFNLNFHDRMFNVHGNAVGSIVNPAPLASDPTVDDGKIYGTGGEVVAGKLGGNIRGNLVGRWESSRLDINDMGFLSAPDEVVSAGWLQWRYDAKGEKPRFNAGNVNLNAHKTWLQAGSRVLADDGSVLWDYSPGHRQDSGGNINGFLQFRNYREVFYGVWYNHEGTDKYQTRGGPLFTMPERGGFWIGGSSDTRKRFYATTELEWWEDAAGTTATDIELINNWTMSSRLALSLAARYNDLHDDSQYIETIEHADPSLGIGGKSYIFGELDSDTIDITLRSSVLFNRRQSLELYFQPFLVVGDYTKAKELARPNSYDFAEYTRDGYDPNNFDDTFASVNMNMVYRWEYRPGSTLYLVWTHSREEYQQRQENGGPNFDTDLSTGKLFTNEPANTLLAKLTYWFAL
jgi:hypothetical protein